MGKARRGSILVIEDDSDVRAILVETLADEGHDVRACEIDELPRGRFSLVLTDFPFWPYDAERARRWIRQLRARYANARILLCTAQRVVHRESDGLGADVILDKPFDLSDLFARVSGLVGEPGRAGAGAALAAAAG